jgi:UDP-glucose:(heptosyl)LPS alpha-1,3-glucosyltransferase
MKIALVILHADPARGGAERYTIDLAAALATRGHSVALLATSFNYGVVPQGVTPIGLSARGLTRSARYADMLDSLTQLADSRFDVVHAMLPVRAGQCDVYHPHAGLALDAAQRMSPLKRVLNRRRVRFSAVEQELLTSARPPVVLCLSEYVKRDVRRLYPNLPQEKLATLFNAVDLKKFDPAKPFAREAGREDLFPANPDRPFALMIAQDFARKGLRETLEALAAMDPKERPALVVFGKGDAGPYQRLSRTLRLDGDVVFRGPTHAPDREYRKADFFVLPTKHDPCSLVVLEALAMGLPVISTKFNGACEIMTDGVHGYVLEDPRDVATLAEAMRKMLDPTRRAAMSRACLELRPRLSYEHHLDQLEAIYRGVVAARS